MRFIDIIPNYNREKLNVNRYFLNLIKIYL